MLDWFRNIFYSPETPDPDLARLLKIAQSFFIIPTIYTTAVGILLWKHNLIPKIFILVILISALSILIFSFFLQYKGNIHFSRLLLLSLLWLCTTIIIYYIYKGDFSNSIDSYLLVIIFAGFLLGAKTALIFAIINLISLISFSFFIPIANINQINPQIGLFIHLGNFLLITVLVIFTDQFFRWGYQVVKDKEQELIKINDELTEIQSHLEKHVEDRSREIISQKLYYEALVKNSPLAIVTLDLNHHIIACNPAFEYMFGYSEEEVVGINLDDLITTPSVAAEAKIYTQRALNGESVYGIGKRRTKSGELIDVEIHGVPVMVENKLIGVYALYNDITHRILTEEALRESEERHRIFFENVPVPLWEEDFSEVKKYIDVLKNRGISDFRAYFNEQPEVIAHCAKLAKIINVNHATLCLYHAKDKEELIGSLNKILVDLSYKAFQEEICSLIDGKNSFSFEIINRTLTGQLITVRIELSLAPGFENTWSKVFISTTDITSQKQAQDELRDSEIRQRLILESMPVLMFAMNDKNLITTWNQECEITTGYRSEEIINNPKALEYLFPNPDYRKYALFELERRGHDFNNLELEFTSKNGSKKIISWSNISSRLPIPGWSFWATGVDITERKAAEEQLKYLASHDTLTELPNRALFNDRLNHAIPLAKRNHQQLAVMFLDLDNFKMVNDTLGHEKGDELLIEVANRIVKCLRESDTVARIGGDEFAFVLENINVKEDITKIVEKISKAISASMIIGGLTWNITPSIGITIFPDDGNDAETLIKKADIAMYAVKEKGKNRYQFFSTMSVTA